MSVSKPMTTPFAESVTVKLGRETIHRLRDFAMKESIRRMDNVSATDIIKEALKNTYPSLVP